MADRLRTRSLHKKDLRTRGAGVLRRRRKDAPTAPPATRAAHASPIIRAILVGERTAFLLRPVGGRRSVHKKEWLSKRLGERGGDVLVDQEPGIAAFFPDAGIAEIELHVFAVLGFFGEVHGDSGPGDGAAASGF